MVQKEAILFFHGGGWTTESVETYDRVCARMAQSTGQIVVSVEYRLAPEHRFPTGLEDCYAAAHGNAARGDSAGGNGRKMSRSWATAQEEILRLRSA